MENIVIPDILFEAMNNFSSFYLRQYVGRRLQFVHSLGQFQLNAVFGCQVEKRRYKLDVSEFQGLVLLLFSERNNLLSFSDILAKTMVLRVMN